MWIDVKGENLGDEIWLNPDNEGEKEKDSEHSDRLNNGKNKREVFPCTNQSSQVAAKDVTFSLTQPLIMRVVCALHYSTSLT